MAKVDTSDLGPNTNGSVDQEGVNQERNGVDEEHKIIEGAGEGTSGQNRENDLNLGAKGDGSAQINGDGVGKKANAHQSEHLSSDCFVRIEFQRQSLEAKSKKGLAMAIKRQL